MGRSSKAEVSSDAATSASSAGTAGAPAATPRPTSAGDDAQGRCATMMPMSAVAVVLAVRALVGVHGQNEEWATLKIDFKNAFMVLISLSF